MNNIASQASGIESNGLKSKCQAESVPEKLHSLVSGLRGGRNFEQLFRDAKGMEALARQLQEETDPVRLANLANALAEMICN